MIATIGLIALGLALGGLIGAGAVYVYIVFLFWPRRFMGDAFKEVMNLVVGIIAMFFVLGIGATLVAVGAFIYDQFWPPKTPPTRNGELFDSVQVIDGTGHVCEKKMKDPE